MRKFQKIIKITLVALLLTLSIPRANAESPHGTMSDFGNIIAEYDGMIGLMRISDWVRIDVEVPSVVDFYYEGFYCNELEERGCEGETYGVVSAYLGDRPRYGVVDVELDGNDVAVISYTQTDFTTCGDDEFSVFITDHAYYNPFTDWTDTTEHRILIERVCPRPVLEAKTINIQEDHSKTVITAVTIDTSAITAHNFITSPSHGTASYNNATKELPYTPTADYCGPDTLTMSVTASKGTSIPTTFPITVSCVNDSPVAHLETVTLTVEIATDKAISFNVTDSDNSGNEVTVTLDKNPSFITYNYNSNDMTGNILISDKSVVGSYTARLVIYDGTAYNFKYVMIRIKDSRPVVAAQTITAIEDTIAKAFVSISTSGSVITAYDFTKQPAHGTASFETKYNRLHYMPAADYCGPDTLDFTVTTSHGTSIAKTFPITVNCVNDAPIISMASDNYTVDIVDITVGKKFFYSIVDVDSSALTVEISNNPDFITLEHDTVNNTGYISLSNKVVKGNYYVILKISDGTITTTKGISINVVDNRPRILQSFINVNENSTVTKWTTVITDGKPILSHNFITSPAHGTAVYTTLKQILYTPTADYCGPDTLTMTVTTANGTSIANTFPITVNCVDKKPIINNVSGFIAEDTSHKFGVSMDTDHLGITDKTIEKQPSHGSVVWDNSSVNYTPNPNYCGLDVFSYSITTAAGKSNIAKGNINVTCVNDAPTISGTPVKTVNEDSYYSFNPVAADVDIGDTKLFAITNKPTWATFSTSTGKLSGIPGNEHIGTTSNIVISVRDRAGSTALLTAFSLTIVNVNDAPIISVDNSSDIFVVDMGIGKKIPYSIVDVDDSIVYAELLNNSSPITLEENNKTGYIVIPKGLFPSTYLVRISAKDNKTTGNNVGLVISVKDTRPLLATQHIIINEDTVKRVGIRISVDKSTVTAHNFITRPSHGTASYDNATNVLKYTPNSDYCGSDTLTMTVTASKGTSIPTTFPIRVDCVNDAPTISGIPTKTVNEDSAYSFTPQAADVDSGDRKTFSIINKPTWASFSTTTGELSGTPSNQHVGLTTSILISVRDRAGLTAHLATFSLAVINGNDAPTISGTPIKTVNEDAAYSFTPQAADADAGDTKTFSITNKPSWATFSSTTGKLSGTPRNQNVGTTSNIVISVRDRVGTTASLAAFSLTVINTNDAPTISGAPAKTVNEDSGYSFTPVAVDVDAGDTKVFSILNKPVWATFSTATGKLSGTPSNQHVGLASSIIISVHDRAGSTASLPVFSIQVINGNDAPTISGNPTKTVNEDTAYSFTPSAADADAGDTKTFTIINKPTWATFSATTGKLSGTPRNEHVGTTNNIVISVRDRAGSTASLAAFSLTVVNVNDKPTISGTPARTVNEDSGYSFTPAAADVDKGDTKTFTIINKPSWATFSSTTGKLSGTPSNQHVGLASSIMISVHDRAGSTASLPVFSIQVINGNDAPTISGNPTKTVNEDTAYSFTPSAADADAGDTKTFTIINKPSWATFSSTTGKLSGTPSNQNVGTTSNIVISVRDRAGSTASLPVFSLTVVNINDNPTISGTPARTVNEDSAYTFSPTVVDVDKGDTKRFTIINKPSWATFSATTGKLSGSPRNEHVGTTNNIVISVRDRAGSTASLPVFSIEVINGNDAPTITGNPTKTVNEDTAYSFTPSAADADAGDTKIFTIINKPTWATFSATTGKLSGSPRNEHVGTTNNIVISVRDRAGSTASLAAFSLTVVNVNDKPTISGTPARTVNEDSAYTFSPTVVDVDKGDTKRFTIINKPSWATFSSTTGKLSGTPRNQHVGLASSIMISVHDRAGSTASLPVFSIQVINTNDAPTVSGTPLKSVKEDSAYSFFPVASDVDIGDTKIFTIINKPTWSTFNSTTGRLSGTPLNQHVGTTSNIVISVRDRAGSTASLPAFSLTVVNENDAPVITVISNHTVDMATGNNIAYSVTDIDSSTITATLTGNPSFITLSHKNKTGYIVVSDKGIAGAYSVTLTVNDGDLTATKVVYITVSDYRPVLKASSIILDEDYVKRTYTPISVDRSSVTAHNFITSPSHGIASYDNATRVLKYLPHPDYCGLDTLTMTVTASKGTSIPKTFPITVNCINDAPIVTVKSTNTADMAVGKNIVYSVTDVDSSTITAVLTGNPSFITLSHNNKAGNIVVSDKGIAGAYKVTLTINDGELTATKVVNITIYDYRPVLVAQTITLAEDTTKTITTKVTVDTSALTTHNFIKRPVHGIASYNNATKRLKYEPTADYCGTDTLTMTVSALKGTSIAKTFPITVNCVNDAPVITVTANNTVDMATGKNIAFSVIDIDNNACCNTTLSGNPSFIWLSHTNKTGNIVVNNNGVAGTYNVVLTVSDGALTAQRTVTINVVDYRPVLAAQTIILDEDATITIATKITIDTSPITAHNFTKRPIHGTASYNNAAKELTYIPTADYCGTDSLIMTVTASSGISIAKTFPITVNCVNDAPVITVTANNTVDMATGKNIAYTVTDIDNSTITASISGHPSFISLSHSNKTGKIVVNNIGVAGIYNIVLSVSDGTLTTQRTVTINIVDYRPLLAAQTITLDEDSIITIATKVTIDTSELIKHDFTKRPIHGTVSYSNSTKVLTYTPTADYCGTDTLTMTVTASRGTSIAKTFPITINCVNDAPVITINKNNQVNIGDALDIIYTVTDIDNINVTTDIKLVNSVSDLPPFIVIQQQNKSGQVAVSSENDVGLFEIVITTTDGHLSAESIFTISIEDLKNIIDDNGQSESLFADRVLLDEDDNPITYLHAKGVTNKYRKLITGLINVTVKSNAKSSTAGLVHGNRIEPGTEIVFDYQIINPGEIMMLVLPESVGNMDLTMTVELN